MFVAGAAADGLNCAPPPSLDPRCRPHPIGTFLQSITLTGRWRDVPRKTFVGAHGWEGSPFLELYRRLSHEPDWTTFSVQLRTQRSASATGGLNSNIVGTELIGKPPQII